MKQKNGWDYMPQCYLEISGRSGADIRRVKLSGKQSVLGRGRNCDVQLPGSKISRRHARIEISPEGPIITDLESANGTYLNGKRVVVTTRLKSGDVLWIGDWRITVRISGKEAEALPNSFDITLQVSGEAQPVRVSTLPFYLGMDRKTGKVIPTSDPYAQHNLVKIFLAGNGFVIQNMYEKDFIQLNGKPFTKAAISKGDAVQLAGLNCTFNLTPAGPEEKNLSSRRKLTSLGDKKRRFRKYFFYGGGILILLIVTATWLILRNRVREKEQPVEWDVKLQQITRYLDDHPALTDSLSATQNFDGPVNSIIGYVRENDSRYRQLRKRFEEINGNAALRLSMNAMYPGFLEKAAAVFKMTDHLSEFPDLLDNLENKNDRLAISLEKFQKNPSRKNAFILKGAVRDAKPVYSKAVGRLETLAEEIEKVQGGISTLRNGLGQLEEYVHTAQWKAFLDNFETRLQRLKGVTTARKRHLQAIDRMVGELNALIPEEQTGGTEYGLT